MDFDDRVRVAHGDAWQAIGEAHRATGGGTAILPGVRLMASGLPHRQWNGGDVDDPGAVDIDAVTAWYAERMVPWGLCLPAGREWPHGRLLLTLRLMGLTAESFTPAVPDGVRLRLAGRADLDEVLAIDAAAFESDVDTARPWLAPHLDASGIATAIAELDGRPVGTAYCVRSDGWAGPAAYLAGVGVVPEARRRGVGGALSSWLLGRALESGCRFASLSPDDDRAASLYARLGFVEVPGLDVHVPDVE